jgi:hypothetical protein
MEYKINNLQINIFYIIGGSDGWKKNNPLWNRTIKLFGRPKNEWSTIDEMIYKLPDFLNNSLKVIEPMRFKAIKESLRYHYNNSRFYNQLCKEYKFTPEDIKT